MTVLHAIILGLVEGITEYLPVSSTGHLILAQRAMGIPASDEANAYAVCIQAGAIAAVLGLYAGRVGRMLTGLLGRDPEGRQMAVNLVAAVIPAGIIGLALEKRIEQYLFGLWPVVAAWAVGGLVILAMDGWVDRSRRTGRELADLSWKAGLVIGAMQTLALWPGTSRSFAAILGGLLVGLRLPAAVEFSFLLGVVTLGGATGVKALKYGPLIVARYGVVNPIIGFVVATVSAVAAVRWMVAYLNRRGLCLFGWYRLLLAAAVGSLLLAGVFRH
ncbi:MAG: undecaprenyl-diphosphate phosphatase [Candidatus Methylomirabilota bacterium]